MVLANLRPDVRDIDLFASSELFSELETLGFIVDSSRPDVPRIEVAQDIDVFRTFPGVTYERVLEGAKLTPRSRGFLVADLRDVLAFKRACNRDKDQKDIQELERALFSTFELADLPPTVSIQVNLHGEALLVRRLSSGEEEVAENWAVLQEQAAQEVRRQGGSTEVACSYRCPQDLAIKAKWPSGTLPMA